jgi:hypothetical protein
MSELSSALNPQGILCTLREICLHTSLSDLPPGKERAMQVEDVRLLVYSYGDRDLRSRRICCLASAPLASTLLLIMAVGCSPLARIHMAVHVLAKVEHSNGAPAVGFPIWLVDRVVKPLGYDAALPRVPACRTSIKGECVATVVYHYCETVFPWGRNAQVEYEARFELVTLKGEKIKSLGFLHGVKRRSSYLEGTLWARID